MIELTQKELKRRFHYDPDTGAFTRLVTVCPRGKAGDTVGTLNYGYLFTKINYRRYRLHRLAFLYMNGAFPPDQTDHINHIRTDNRWGNLRHATNQDNGKNQKMHSTNTSGHVGIHWFKPTKKWQSRIYVNKKHIHLGYFIDINDAIAIRKEAEIKYNFHLNHGAAS